MKQIIWDILYNLSKIQSSEGSDIVVFITAVIINIIASNFSFPGNSNKV